MGVKVKEQLSDRVVDPAMLSICSGEEHTVFFPRYKRNLNILQKYCSLWRGSQLRYFGWICYLKVPICRHIGGKYKELLALIVYFENSKVIPKTSTILWAASDLLLLHWALGGPSTEGAL